MNEGANIVAHLGQAEEFSNTTLRLASMSNYQMLTCDSPLAGYTCNLSWSITVLAQPASASLTDQWQVQAPLIPFLCL